MEKMTTEEIGTTFINGNITEAKENIKTINDFRKVTIYIKEYYPTELDRFLNLIFNQ